LDSAFQFFAGIDWGSDKHRVCLTGRDGAAASTSGCETLSTTGRGLASSSILKARCVTPPCVPAGHSHGRALRGMADRWLKTLTSMLTTRTLYDAQRRAA